jgi:hypothetical protein
VDVSNSTDDATSVVCGSLLGAAQRFNLSIRSSLTFRVSVSIHLVT